MSCTTWAWTDGCLWQKHINRKNMNDSRAWHGIQSYERCQYSSSYSAASPLSSGRANPSWTKWAMQQQVHQRNQILQLNFYNICMWCDWCPSPFQCLELVDSPALRIFSQRAITYVFYAIRKYTAMFQRPKGVNNMPRVVIQPCLHWDCKSKLQFVALICHPNSVL